MVWPGFVQLPILSHIFFLNIFFFLHPFLYVNFYIFLSNLFSHCGLRLTTLRTRVLCSSDWAIQTPLSIHFLNAVKFIIRRLYFNELHWDCQWNTSKAVCFPSAFTWARLKVFLYSAKGHLKTIGKETSAILYLLDKYLKNIRSWIQQVQRVTLPVCSHVK